jgi:hypothetical protein
LANLFFFALLPNKADVPIKTLMEKEAIISCLKSSAVNHRRRRSLIMKQLNIISPSNLFGCLEKRNGDTLGDGRKDLQN